MDKLYFESFNNYISNKNTVNGLIPFGGFIPETPNKLTEAEDPQTYSKTPILFNRDDIAYLMQFPPELQKAALSIRYNNLIVTSKFHQKKGKEIGDRQDILIPGRAGAIYRFKNAYTGIKQLIERLEIPRDTDQLRHGDPNELKSNYKGGLYEYNLDSGEKLQKTPTGQYVTKAFLGMSWDNANKIMNTWRDAIIPGWLGRPKVETPYKPVSFGGGKPRGLNLDWNGQVIEHPKGKLVMPVYTGDDLKRIKFQKSGPALFNPSQVNSDGEMAHQYEILKSPNNIASGDVEKWQQSVIDSYYETGKLPNDGWEAQQSPHSLMPVLRPGALVSAHAVRQYDAVLKEIRIAHASGNMKEIQTLSERAKQFLPDSESEDAAKKYSEIDYLLGRFNPKAQAMGLGRDVFNTQKKGGVEVLSNTKETLPGNEEEKNLLQKYFIYSGVNSRGQWSTIDLNGSSQMQSAVAQGVTTEFKNMASSHHGRGMVNLATMKMFIDDFLQESAMSVLKLAGDPLFKDFYKAIKEKSPNLKHIHAQAWRKVKDRARIFTQTVSQFDWGQGTRRKLRFGGDISGDASIGTGDTNYFANIGKIDPSLNALIGKDDDSDNSIPMDVPGKRSSGQRSDVRTRGGINPVGMTANMFQSGHSPDAIAAEIAAHAKQREASVNSGNWSEEQSVKSLQDDVKLASTLMQNNLTDALKVNSDENEAIKKAEATTRSQLASKGVKISKPMEQMGLFDNQEMPELPKKTRTKKAVAEPVATQQPQATGTAGASLAGYVSTLNQKQLADYVSTPNFINTLKKNPAELEQLKQVAGKLKSKALIAAITAAEAPAPSIKLPAVSNNNDDAADAADIQNYRSVRLGGRR